MCAHLDHRDGSCTLVNCFSHEDLVREAWTHRVKAMRRTQDRLGRVAQGRIGCDEGAAAQDVRWISAPDTPRRYRDDGAELRRDFAVYNRSAIFVRTQWPSDTGWQVHGQRNGKNPNPARNQSPDPVVRSGFWANITIDFDPRA